MKTSIGILNGNAMKVYLIRHGKDDDRYRGGWSNLGLIKEGEEQSQRLASYLKQHSKEYPISQIISSDLKRAICTAKAIQKELDVPITLSKDWREMNNGDLAGMLNSVALEKYPELFFNTLRMDECYPNGESPIDFFNRIKITFDKLLKDELNNNVAIVTHSGVINIIYHIVKNIEWSNKNKTFPIKNVSLHTLEYKDGKVEFLEENKMVI